MFTGNFDSSDVKINTKNYEIKRYLVTKILTRLKFRKNCESCPSDGPPRSIVISFPFLNIQMARIEKCRLPVLVSGAKRVYFIKSLHFMPILTDIIYFSRLST